MCREREGLKPLKVQNESFPKIEPSNQKDRLTQTTKYLVQYCMFILVIDDVEVYDEEEDSKELVAIEIKEIEQQRKLINYANYEKRKELKNLKNKSIKVQGYV